MHSIYNLAWKELSYLHVFFPITMRPSWIFMLARDQRERPDYHVPLESSCDVDTQIYNNTVSGLCGGRSF